MSARSEHDGPDFGDGCDREGFPSGCERMGYHCEDCPNRPETKDKFLQIASGLIEGEMTDQTPARCTVCGSRPCSCTVGDYL